jgi:hypothetical protein
MQRNKRDLEMENKELWEELEEIYAHLSELFDDEGDDEGDPEE